jgi:hypothetical protein
MSRLFSAAGIFVAVFCGASAVAQTPAASEWKLEMRTLAATSGVGLSNGALIDRPEIRIIRVDLQPGSVRLLHTHDDVRYHLMIPITGGAQANFSPTDSVPLQQWQPVFFQGGSTHGFQNNSTSTLSVMEIFVRK